MDVLAINITNSNKLNLEIINIKTYMFLSEYYKDLINFLENWLFKDKWYFIYKEY